MKNMVPYVPAMMLSLFLSGCAISPTVEANRAALSGIKHIAVVDLGFPNTASVRNSGIGGGLGVIGGAIEGAANAENSKSFSATIANHVPTLHEALVSAVADDLIKQGYQITIIKDQKPSRSSDRHAWDFSKIHTDADAVLVVCAPLCGYVCSAHSVHYEPQVMIKVQLSDTKSQAMLYQKTFFVGYKAVSIRAEDISADDLKRYKSFDDINLHASEAVDELIACEVTGAKKIVRDITGH